MAIEVYPSLMQGAPIETHEAGNMTLGEWLASKGIDYAAHETQPVQIAVNGSVIESARWTEYQFTSSDRIEIRILPQGGVFNALGSIIGKVFNAVFGWMVPKTKSPGTSNTTSGEKLEASNATANQARLGEAVPEHAGRYRRYPDYLVPPRRYFQDKRFQWVRFLACVGVGSYAINPDEVKVGDTPLAQLGDDAAFTLYPPGYDLGGVEPAAEHWHTTEEVGGTSSGTPGLVLSTELANRENWNPASYTFDGDWIGRPGSEWPVGWGVGTQVQVEYPRTYTVVNVDIPNPVDPMEPDETRSEITGYFGHIPGIDEEMVISMGPWEDLDTYRISRLWDEGDGIYTIRLESVRDDPVTEQPVPIIFPPGTRTYIFGANVSRSVATFEPEAMGLYPGGFETGVISVPGARVRYTGGVTYGEWSSEFVAVPGNETTDVIEWDVFFPNGLAFVADDGELESRTVQTQMQYRDIDTNVRTTITKTYTEATLDQIGFTESVTVSPMRPAVRMRRVTAESTSTQVQDKCHWYGLKAHLPSRLIYPNWTTMAVALRSGGRLAAQSENKINLIATRVLPELQSDGTWSAPTGTRHIAAFFRYILTTIGYTDSQIDMAELRRLNDTWNARGDTFNHVFDETTVKEAIDTVLIAGMAEMTVEDGRIRPVRDEPRTVFEQAYSAQNMTSPLRRAFRARRVDDVDGVEVEFTDIDTWTKTTVKCLLGGDAGEKLEKLSLKGAFDRTRAWRIGMRRRRVLRFRNWDYSFSTEMDALNSRYLSYVPLIDESSEYSQSAILLHAQAVGGQALLRVSEPMRWHAGQTHVVAYRDPEGKLVGPFSAAPGPDEYSVLADMPEPYPVITLKREPPHVYFGTSAQWSFPALITGVTPQGMENVSVSAEDYHPAVYDDDNASPSA